MAELCVSVCVVCTHMHVCVHKNYKAESEESRGTVFEESIHEPNFCLSSFSLVKQKGRKDISQTAQT